MTSLFISTLATITGVFMAFSNGLQALKIFRLKSAHDISPSAFTILTIGAFIWVLYGIEINNIPIIISNTIGFICTTAVLIGYVLYK